MKQREFEMEVKEKMGAFDMQPSDEVWLEVERRIRKEKKRRFIFWWPLFALLLTAGAGTYFLTVNKKSNSREEKIVADGNSLSKEKRTVPGITERQDDRTRMKDNKADNFIKPGKAGGGDIHNTVPYDNSFFNQLKKKTNIALPGEKTFHVVYPANKTKQERTKGDKQNPELHAKQQPGIVTNNNLTPFSEIQDSDNFKISSPATNQLVVDKGITDSNSKTGNINLVPGNKKDDSTTNENEVAAKKETRNRNGWKWGASFSIGKSSLADGFTVLNKAFSADAFNQSVLASGGTLTSFNSSSLRKGASFQAGVFMQKPISKKLDLRFSANYSFLSWSFNVGLKVDSVIRVGSVNNGSSGSTVVLPGNLVNGYYRWVNSSSSTIRYNNNYHFLGLSAELSWRLVQGKKINLNWDNGLGLNSLLASNMLHFSSVIPGYYKDNSLLAKQQLIFITGLSLNAGKRFYIGPVVNYGLTTVLKNSIGVKKHFSSIGINARFLFHK